MRRLHAADLLCGVINGLEPLRISDSLHGGQDCGIIHTMKWSKSLIQTLREDPGDAEIDSHKLLIRAGLARKVAGGLYAYLPLGMRSLRKIQQIVREEMDRAGALEIVSPILQPAELWRTTGRWDTMGPNMFKLRDRGEHEIALGPRRSSPTSRKGLSAPTGSFLSQSTRYSGSSATRRVRGLASCARRSS